jgi:Na+/H+-translocating membrane pyrophosphatase
LAVPLILFQVADNADGIAEMAEMPAAVRAKTHALDAAGTTSAAIGHTHTHTYIQTYTHIYINSRI